MIGRLVLAVILAAAPLSAADPIRVLVFTTTDCPISNRYAPELERLHRDYGSRGVAFFLVYPDPAVEASQRLRGFTSSDASSARAPARPRRVDIVIRFATLPDAVLIFGSASLELALHG